MCGLAGFFTSQGLSDQDGLIARRMGESLRHRGPDGSGEWLDREAGFALAHRRLAIIELSDAGQQPMASSDKRWVLAYNGEIYNHTEIRQELEQQSGGHIWRGHSDTETLLEAIARWGVNAALGKAQGMFAFALWDRKTRSLTLARDRLGEKPLYFGKHRGVLIFGSELKALQAHPDCAAEIDRGALALLLRFGYVPAPWSIIAGIRKLPPGTTVTVHHPTEVPEPRPYWSARSIPAARSAIPSPSLGDDAATDELDRLLQQSVSAQQRADVPVGAFLSGGVDSSIITAIMQRLYSRPLRSFTIGFEEQDHDESSHARAVARHLGTDHSEWILTSKDARDIIPSLPSVYCEPLADPSQVPTVLLSRLARRDVTVCLSGDGGDELFGGYQRYHWAQRLASIPLALRHLCAALLRTMPADAWSALLAPLAYWLPSELKGGQRADKLRKLTSVLRSVDDDDLYEQIVSFWPRTLTPTLARDERPSAFDDRLKLPDFGDRMMMTDLRAYLPDDILVKVDRAAMAVSLETRMPLLDHRLVEFSLRLPSHMKFRGGQSKWLLRRVLARYVPESLTDRPKMGFGIPVHAWLRGPLREWAEELLAESRLRQGGLLAPKPIRALWREHLTGKNDWGYRLWPVLMFEAWREKQQFLT